MFQNSFIRKINICTISCNMELTRFLVQELGQESPNQSMSIYSVLESVGVMKCYVEMKTYVVFLIQFHFYHKIHQLDLMEVMLPNE